MNPVFKDWTLDVLQSVCTTTAALAGGRIRALVLEQHSEVNGMQTIQNLFDNNADPQKGLCSTV